MVEELLVCKNLSKTYKALGTNVVTALDNVSLSLRHRDILFVCGNNGSGKTTLLKLISGQEECDSGEIMFRDVPLFANPDDDPCDHCIWIPQSLDDAVAEHVRIDELASISKRHRILQLAEELEAHWLIESIQNKRKRKLIGELSGGQKQLLVGLVALAEPKPILLMDEAMRSLDMSTISLYWEAVETCIRESNGCAIIVTHDLKFAKDNATRLLVLRNGEPSLNVSPSEISLEKLAIEVANL